MIKIRDKTIKIGLQLSLAWLAIQLLLLAFFWRKLPSQVPLFYSRPWGTEQLVRPGGLLILPALSFLVMLINAVAVSLISGEEKLINQLLIIFTTIFSFLCLITLFKIITLIT